MNMLANITIASGVLSFLCLLALHFTSSEYKPGWRMISEYATGKYKWLITSFFFLWGLSSLSLAVLLWGVVSTTWAKVGVVFLMLSAIGEIMGGLFDVKHKLHGVAFGIGVPSVPIAALLIGYNLADLEHWNVYHAAIITSSHSTWISLILMAVSMGVMFAGFKKAGLPMDKNAEPPEKLPEGVIAFGGYANRLLVVCDIVWLMLLAAIYLSL